MQSEGVQRDSDDENMEEFDGESFIQKERVRRLHQDWLFRRCVHNAIDVCDENDLIFITTIFYNAGQRTRS